VPTAPKLAGMSVGSAAVVRALAPGGRLRVCINAGNAVLAHRHVVTEALARHGVDGAAVAPAARWC
jgi:hypothetical protein